MVNLPYELMDKIRRMSYKSQSIDMLNQIKIRHRFKKQLYDTYTPIYNYELTTDPKAIENWIVNDISLYLNSEQGSMYGYLDNYYDILARNIVFNTREKIDKFSNLFIITPNVGVSFKDTKPNINIYLGLLNMDEINDFKKYFKKIYNIDL